MVCHASQCADIPVRHVNNRSVLRADCRRLAHGRYDNRRDNRLRLHFRLRVQSCTPRAKSPRNRHGHHGDYMFGRVHLLPADTESVVNQPAHGGKLLHLGDMGTAGLRVFQLPVQARRKNFRHRTDRLAGNVLSGILRRAYVDARKNVRRADGIHTGNEHILLEQHRRAALRLHEHAGA